MYVDNHKTNETIVDKDFFVYWENSGNSYDAPIIKVTVNGRPYVKPIIDRNGSPTNADKVVMKNSGEYVFEFTDLAGNVKTYKVTINRSSKICLNNVGIAPKKQYILNIESLTIYNEDYNFSKDDVIVLATPTNYFGGSSECGIDTLNYKSISKKSYLLVGDIADYANKNKSLTLALGDNVKNTINELGGYFYVFVVDLDVAKNDLGFPIGENFFTKDPLGWTLIFIAGAAVLYSGIKLVFFRKKVRVLK